MQFCLTCFAGESRSSGETGAGREGAEPGQYPPGQGGPAHLVDDLHQECPTTA